MAASGGGPEAAPTARGGGELPEAVSATATEPEMRHGLLPTQRQPHRRRRRAPAPTAVLLCCRRQPPLAKAGAAVPEPGPARPRLSGPEGET